MPSACIVCHKVDLVPAGDVLIGRYPVTNALFARFRPDHPRLGSDDHPVVLVTRADAEAYARHVGGRLPTSAEWKAAAGHTTWPWGDSFDQERCNCVEAGWGCTVPVDQYPGEPGRPAPSSSPGTYGSGWPTTCPTAGAS
jgi:formylglycine-generating enzyme required for sulfatase activity